MLSSIAVAACGPLLYGIWLTIERLYLSPIAHFPGPKIAALTSWYEAYFDLVKTGQYYKQIWKLHQIYGPIIRINPTELHVNDPEFFRELFVGDREKRDFFTDVAALRGSIAVTDEHGLHKRRRAMVQPYFTTRAVTGYEPMITDRVQTLCQMLEAKKGTIVRLDHALTALAMDVITAITFEKPTHCLMDDDFRPELYKILDHACSVLPALNHFKFIIKFLNHMPRSVVMYLNKFNPWGHIVEMLTRQHIIEAKKRIALGKPGNSVIDQMLHANPHAPASELSIDRLSGEAHAMVLAASLTLPSDTGLAVAHILTNSEIKFKLQEELAPAFAKFPEHQPTLQELEKLPYLTGVVKESIRLNSLLHRLPRISPNNPLIYKDWIIPPGIEVGMTPSFQSRDPALWPEAEKFIPERWLEKPTPSQNLGFVPFVKGDRACIGIHVAYAEMRLAIAFLFRPGGFEMELFETKLEDIIAVHDLLVPRPPPNSKGLRILVR